MIQWTSGVGFWSAVECKLLNFEVVVELEYPCWEWVGVWLSGRAGTEPWVWSPTSQENQNKIEYQHLVNKAE
jgi:hypothetical protein